MLWMGLRAFADVPLPGTYISSCETVVCAFILCCRQHQLHCRYRAGRFGFQSSGLDEAATHWRCMPPAQQGSFLLSAVCHALASRCLLPQEVMRARKLQTILTAHMSVGALCVRLLCALRMMFCGSILVCCEWGRCESTRKLLESRREGKRERGRHLFLHSFLVPQLRPSINVCCQASRRAKRAAKEEEILAQSALSFRDAFGWLERCAPVALCCVISLL